MRGKWLAFAFAITVVASAVMYVQVVGTEHADAHGATYEYYNKRLGTSDACGEIFGQDGEGDIAYRYHEDTTQTLAYSLTDVQQYVAASNLCTGSDVYGIYLPPYRIFNNHVVLHMPDWEEGAIKPCWETPGYTGYGPDLRYSQPSDGYTMGYGWLTEFTGPCGGFTVDPADLSGGEYTYNWELTDWQITYKNHTYTGFHQDPQQYPSQSGQTAWGKHYYSRQSYLPICQFICNHAGLQQTPPHATQREVKSCGLTCNQQ